MNVEPNFQEGCQAQQRNRERHTPTKRMEEEPHNTSSSSSDDEDGDDEWRAAINAAASTLLGCSQPNQTPTPAPDNDDEDARTLQPQPIKHYQIKAQKTLDDIMKKSLDVVKTSDTIDISDDYPVANGGVRLFKQAPVGIVFDHRVELKGPKKKPRILPGEAINEKSKKFKKQLQSVVVEGTDILATAKDTSLKSLSKMKAKEAAAKEAAKREEERVAQLKKIRGEKWLPSIAREMQQKSRVR